MTSNNEIITRTFLDTEEDNQRELAWTTRMETQGYRLARYEPLSQRNRWHLPTRWKTTMALSAMPDNG